jgi:hypothetical protein
MRTSSSLTGVVKAALLLLSLAMAVPGTTAEQNQPEVASPVKPPEGQASPSAKRAPARASTFTPSEKIKADSSVSFPVDI